MGSRINVCVGRKGTRWVNADSFLFLRFHLLIKPHVVNLLKGVPQHF